MNSWNSSRSVTQLTSSLQKCKNKAAEKRECKAANKEKMLSTNYMLLLTAKIPQTVTMIISPSMPDKRTFVVHTVIIDMTCCGNPEPITIGITKTIARLQIHPP